MRMLACICLIFAFYKGCERPVLTHRQRTKHPDGTVQESETNMRGSANAKDASKVKTSSIDATLAPNYEPPKEDATMKTTTRTSIVIAAICGLLAVGSFAARRWFPLIPSQVPVGFGMVAGLLYVAPVLLDRYSGYFAAGLVAWGAWAAWSFHHNDKLKREDPNAT